VIILTRSALIKKGIKNVVHFTFTNLTIYNRRKWKLSEIRYRNRWRI